MWKLTGVVVQVTGVVTIPGGGLGGDQVLLKLPGVGLQATGLVTTPEGSWDGDQVLWKLPGFVCAAYKAGYNTWRNLG